MRKYGGVCHKIPQISAVFKNTPSFPLNPYATPWEDTCQASSSGQKKILYIYIYGMSRMDVRDTFKSIRDMHLNTYATCHKFMKDDWLSEPGHYIWLCVMNNHISCKKKHVHLQSMYTCKIELQVDFHYIKCMGNGKVHLHEH